MANDDPLPKTTEPVAKRAKSPATFHVLALDGSDDQTQTWTLLTKQPVTASNRKEAIRKATDEAGTFWAVPADRFQPVKRATRQETIDVFE
jgi:hypothetical protein